MRVITWSSENAPAPKKWVARWQITDEPHVRPSAGGRGLELFAEIDENGRWKGFIGWASPEGVMQMAFYAETEAEAIALAQADWDRIWEAQRQNKLKAIERAKKSAEARAKREIETEAEEALR